MSIIFSSILDKSYKDEIENLLFFNPQQVDIQSRLEEIIEEYGMPNIIVDDDRLRIFIGNLQEVQSLYAFADNRLIGVMIYLRIDVSTLVILHMGVLEDYSTKGEQAGHMLVTKFVFKLKKIAGKIKGIKYINILYGDGKIQKIRI